MMFKLKFLKKQTIARSQVDQAVDTFMDCLAQQPYFNEAAARDAIAIARDRQITRPVDIWAIYHNSIAYYI